MVYSVIWSKTLLYSQRYAASVCRQIDKAIQNRAVLIPGLNSGLGGFKDTLYQTEKVISFIEQKKRILKLAVMCSEIFDCVSPLLKKTLYIKFSLNKSWENASKMLDLSRRTYFRYINKGLAAFTEIRRRMNLSDEYLTEIFGRDKWIMSFKDKSQEEERVVKKISKTKAKSA